MFNRKILFYRLKKRFTDISFILTSVSTVIVAMLIRYIYNLYCDINIFYEIFNFTLPGFVYLLLMVIIKEFFLCFYTYFLEGMGPHIIAINPSIIGDSLKTNTRGNEVAKPNQSNSGANISGIINIGNTGGNQGITSSEVNTWGNKTSNSDIHVRENNQTSSTNQANRGVNLTNTPNQSNITVSLTELQKARYFDNVDWGDRTQCRAGVDTGPMRIKDPHNQINNYIENGNNQPLLTHIRLSLEYQFNFGSYLSGAMFSPELNNFMLKHIYHTDRPLYHKLMYDGDKLREVPKWRIVSNSERLRNLFR